LFLHAAESVPFGISRFLFGVDYLLPYPWTHVDPLIYALPVAAILYVAVSLATRPLEEKHLAKVFAGLPEPPQPLSKTAGKIKGILPRQIKNWHIFTP
jgi:solute:Na+ symporter, SSS family